jgi:malate synthase
MEDAATAEISRSELWQWVNHGVRTSTGDLIDADFFMRYLNATVQDLGGTQSGRLKEAAGLLAHLVLSQEFTEFLTIPAYELLVGGSQDANTATETQMEI